MISKFTLIIKTNRTILICSIEFKQLTIFICYIKSTPQSFARRNTQLPILSMAYIILFYTPVICLMEYTMLLYTSHLLDGKPYYPFSFARKNKYPTNITGFIAFNNQLEFVIGSIM